MMCQRIGRPPISTIGFGRVLVSSAMRVPMPPARITTFIHLAPDGNPHPVAFQTASIRTGDSWKIDPDLDGIILLTQAYWPFRPEPIPLCPPHRTAVPR